MSDLREKMARTLWERLLREHPTLYRNPEFPSEKDHGTLWTAVDECIRQMEWVRSQCYDCVGGAAEDTSEKIWKMHGNLTPAPDDWKPE